MRKSEKLFDAITDIRDDQVERAEEHKPRRGRRWPAAVAAVLAAALLGGVLLRPGGGSLTTPASAAEVIAEAQYPEMAPYPDETEFWDETTGTFDDDAFQKVYDAWREDQQAQQRPEGYADGLEDFFAASIGEFLSGADGENKVYSPLNVYLALAMLAELTDGNSRQQILETLGTASIEALRRQASDVWNANYRNDGATVCVLASSVWLNENVSFVQKTMDTLAQTYYASSYRGEMGSEEFDQALQNWLNEQTGGLLEEQAGEIGMNAETILALATAIRFQARWADEFSANRTEAGIFHAAAGDVTCDFMHQSGSRTYYWGEAFSAVAQRLENAGNLWFILPDEGVSVDELLEEEQTLEFLLANGAWENSKSVTVNLSVPKFDVTSQSELSEGLQALGVTDVFDAAASDFSSMTRDAGGICVSQVQHDARVAIDEEGCTAAAYTVLETTGATMPPSEEIDFVVDRPFLFVITGADGAPLFAGVVNQP